MKIIQEETKNYRTIEQEIKEAIQQSIHDQVDDSSFENLLRIFNFQKVFENGEEINKATLKEDKQVLLLALKNRVEKTPFPKKSNRFIWRPTL